MQPLGLTYIKDTGDHKDMDPRPTSNAVMLPNYNSCCPSVVRKLTALETLRKYLVDKQAELASTQAEAKVA